MELAAKADQLFGQDVVTVASIAVIAASAMWIVLSRLVVRNLRKAAAIRSHKPLPVEPVKPVRDIWRDPPVPAGSVDEPTAVQQPAK